MAKYVNWTQAEIDASVKIYMEMLSKEKSGVYYVKGEYKRNSIAGALKGRSKSAFERQMQHISSVLQNLGQFYIIGYKPLNSIEAHIANPILESLERFKSLNSRDYEPTPDADKLQERTRKIRKSIDLNSKPFGQVKPKEIRKTISVFYREPVIRAWVLENAKGKCEACDMDAPFVLPEGEPFLEVHHMIPLALEGPDTVENAVALCPNCHRRAHLAQDRDSFIDSIYKKVSRLVI